MTNITLTKKSIIFILSFSLTGIIYSQSTASYDITFNSVWENEIIDPVNGNSTEAIPGNAHWSDLVGATHNSNYTLVAMGALASTGVKNVAEAGSNTALMSEVNTQITNGNANQWLQQGFSPFAAISTATLSTITVSSDFPLLSLVSMIAPSPDWMIAVNSINLRDGNSWRNEIIIPLFPYDAGTDSGATYTSANQPTVPNPDAISVLINSGPFNAKPIGTLTITFNEVLSTATQEVTEVALYPNPSNGNITISTSNANTLKEASVYSVLGKQVASIENNASKAQLQLDLSALNTGIYLVRMVLEDGSHSTKKVVIN